MKKRILDTIQAQGILPLYFNADPAICIGILRALYDAGIRAVEFTDRGPQALENFTRMKNTRDTEMSGLFLGIGTIKSAASACDYIAAGADFIISPGFVPEIATLAAAAGLLYIPGCMTPTEITQAENEGIPLIKLFPGNVLGPGFLQAIRDVFPKLHFMPTGGVETNAESIGSWLRAGACAVGIGSKLITKEAAVQSDLDTLSYNTKMLMSLFSTLTDKHTPA